ncbi:MAG: helix-turn-helix domain-containing protein [Akkermansiaceae bacterium]|nr:helix-turn-helix domain-containing protein [Akkermansiaceae bacterium]
MDFRVWKTRVSENYPTPPKKTSTAGPKNSTITPVKRVLRIDDWFHPDGFPISIERREPQEDFGPHTHEFAELVIVLGGSGLHLSGNDSWKLGVGDVFVIAGPREHEYRDLDELRLVNILYQPKQLNMRLLDLPSVAGYHALFTLEPARRTRQSTRLRLGGRELARVTEMIDRLDEELRAREPGFGFMATASFMHIIGLLARSYGSSPSPDHRATLRIGEALSHLERHIHEDVNLDELANIAHMSRRSFLRVFQSATGTSPLAWRINQRVQRACHLLRNSDKRITEIAFDVGFNDSNYFTRQFRQITGQSPREYRMRR